MANLLDLLGDLPTNLAARKPVDLSISALGSNGAAVATRTVQWFPESLQEQVGADWEERKIPGGSHPLYSYAGGTGRQFSFTLQLTSDRDPGFGVVTSGKDGVAGIRDLDLNEELAWFRSLVLPLYPAQGDSTDGMRLQPPPVIRLKVDGMKWGVDGAAAVNCLFQSLDITYDKLWPSGAPRLVSISVQCVETIQTQGRKIRFLGRSPDWRGGIRSA